MYGAYNPLQLATHYLIGMCWTIQKYIDSKRLANRFESSWYPHLQHTIQSRFLPTIQSCVWTLHDRPYFILYIAWKNIISTLHCIKEHYFLLYIAWTIIISTLYCIKYHYFYSTWQRSMTIISTLHWMNDIALNVVNM